MNCPLFFCSVVNVPLGRSPSLAFCFPMECWSYFVSDDPWSISTHMRAAGTQCGLAAVNPSRDRMACGMHTEIKVWPGPAGCEGRTKAGRSQYRATLSGLKMWPLCYVRLQPNHKTGPALQVQTLPALYSFAAGLHQEASYPAFQTLPASYVVTGRHGGSRAGVIQTRGGVVRYAYEIVSWQSETFLNR